MQIVKFTAKDAEVVGYLHDSVERLPSRSIRPAVVICPGGGYSHLSPREADPPALEFFALGYQVFVVFYSLNDQAANLRPLRELASAVAQVRRNCSTWHVDPERIAVMGFSAGAHLAASLGTLWHREALNLAEARPNAMLLCYPVITMGAYCHKGSRDRVTGGDPELMELLSLENQVTENCPPTFVWHTVNDGSVPVENTLLLISALKKCSVPFECHIFPDGAHGLAMCNQEVETPHSVCAQWVPLSKTWLNGVFGFEP